MGFLDRLDKLANPKKDMSAQAAEIFGEYNAVITNELEDRAFVSMSTSVNKKLAEKYRDFANTLVLQSNAPEYTLLKDIFHSVNARDVHVIVEPTTKVQGINHAVISSLMRSQAYSRIRKITVGDDMRSYVAAVDLYRDIQQQYQDSLEQEQQGGGSEGSSRPSPQTQNKITNSVTAAAGDTANAMEQAEKVHDAMSFGTSRGTVVKDAKLVDQILQYQNIMRDMGLARIVDEMGRLRREHSLEISQSAHKSSAKMNRVSLGGEISRLIPEELMLLDEDFFDTELLIRIQEDRAMIMDGDAPTKTVGPLIFCIDESGSMSGKKNTQAKALALTMMELAAKQGRAYAAILFDKEVSKVVTVKDAGVSDAMEAGLAIAANFSGGGTSFTPPMREALRLLEESPEFLTADIVFITDGAGDLGKTEIDAANNMRESNGLKIATVYIGSRYDAATDTSPLRFVSDKFLGVQNLIEAEAELFQHIA